jgi:hypothetical protein
MRAARPITGLGEPADDHDPRVVVDPVRVGEHSGSRVEGREEAAQVVSRVGIAREVSVLRARGEVGSDQDRTGYVR